MQTVNIFPKTLRFFTILFNQANDVHVKIYEAAHLTLFYVFLNKKIKIHVNFGNVLWVAFSIFICHNYFVIQQGPISPTPVNVNL
jgi:hypothetical protein